MKDIDKCSLCGFCKVNCPVFKVTLNETDSPRGKAVLIKKEYYSNIFYKCTLCKACIQDCPADADIKLRDVRVKLVRNKAETEQNRKMIKNIREHGNPFGKVEKGKKPKELYCC